MFKAIISMRRFMFILLLLPQLVYSQYHSDVFCLKQTENSSQMKFGNSFIQDTVLSLNEKTKILGLSISGYAKLDNDNNSHIRVTLVDEYGNEFLVYENYPILSDDLVVSFTNIAMETIVLDEVVPKFLKISLINSSLKLESVNMLYASKDKKKNLEDSKWIHLLQTKYIVDKLNTNLEKRNKTWRAGLTSMSNKSYAEKKVLFNGIVPVLYGFEHYVGGVFVLPASEASPDVLLENNTSNQYTREWDWRNRHGKNWMTNVKEQLDSTCWAFSANGALEAYINLYYNRLLNYDLSEQELRSCGPASIDGTGNFMNALIYVRNNGIVLEECFPYAGYNVDCANKCPTPGEKIYIQSRGRINIFEDKIKEKLFVAPVMFTISPWRHQVVLAGYKMLKHGDVVYNGNSNTVAPVTIDSMSHTNLIGKTAWLVKNSWGANWGESGYGYVIAAPMEHSCYISGKITSMIYSDSDILCEDADGDGYYFWGIGEKPASCPSWIPDIPDGNDANPNEGRLNMYGVLEQLNPDSIFPLIINDSVEYSVRQSLYSHIIIASNATLTVKNVLNLFGKLTITIQSGGKLVIDGGTITNANIVMNEGSQLLLLNNGLLVCRTDRDFQTPLGAVVELVSGKICNSSDFRLQ